MKPTRMIRALFLAALVALQPLAGWSMDGVKPPPEKHQPPVEGSSSPSIGDSSSEEATEQILLVEFGAGQVSRAVEEYRERVRHAVGSDDTSIATLPDTVGFRVILSLSKELAQKYRTKSGVALALHDVAMGFFNEEFVPRTASALDDADVDLDEKGITGRQFAAQYLGSKRWHKAARQLILNEFEHDFEELQKQMESLLSTEDRVKEEVHHDLRKMNRQRNLKLALSVFEIAAAAGSIAATVVTLGAATPAMVFSCYHGAKASVYLASRLVQNNRKSKKLLKGATQCVQNLVAKLEKEDFDKPLKKAKQIGKELFAGVFDGVVGLPAGFVDSFHSCSKTIDNAYLILCNRYEGLLKTNSTLDKLLTKSDPVDGSGSLGFIDRLRVRKYISDLQHHPVMDAGLRCAAIHDIKALFDEEKINASGIDKIGTWTSLVTSTAITLASVGVSTAELIKTMNEVAQVHSEVANLSAQLQEQAQHVALENAEEIARLHSEIADATLKATNLTILEAVTGHEPFSQQITQAIEWVMEGDDLVGEEVPDGRLLDSWGRLHLRKK